MNKNLKDWMENEKSEDLEVMIKTLKLSRPSIRSSSSCRVIVRIPSVEPDQEKGKKEVEKIPLRPKSASKVRPKRIRAVPSVVQLAAYEKRASGKIFKNKSWIKAYKKYSGDSVESVLSLGFANMKTLPDPHIGEHKRAALRLRKLKRVSSKVDKENKFN